MPDILVYVEVGKDGVSSPSLEILSAARNIAAVTGGAVEALVLSPHAKAPLPQLAAADRIVAVNHAALATYVPEAHLAVLVDVVARRSPAAVLFAYTTAGLDLAPALAVKAKLPLLASCTDVVVADGVVTANSQMYGGKLQATVQTSLPAVLSIMPGAFAETTAKGDVPEVVAQEPPAALDQLRSAFVVEHAPAPDSFDLSRAERIVCIGRGIGGADSIAIARELAEALDAEIAGSRPIIDQGWLARERQVGKSGRRVKPKLYLALGVSGAPEHVEGMRSSDLIIAINSDASAPIFSVAHYGAVCDLFDLVPALSDRLKASSPRL